MRRLRLAAALLVLSPLVAPRGAAAAPARRAQRSPQEVAVMLASTDPEEVRSALESAASLRPTEVLPLIEERVRAGLPPVLLDVAIDTLLLLADAPRSAPLLAELARHRRAAVRVRALEVMAELRAPGVEVALGEALGDHSEAVRGAAAEALGRLATPSSRGALARAVERGSTEAARALGAAAGAPDLHQLGALVTTAPANTLAPLLEALLARADLRTEDKRRVVGRLGDRASDDARALLGELNARLAAAPDAMPAGAGAGGGGR